MRCALINSTTKIVINIVVADPNIDQPHENTELIGIEDNTPVEIGWRYVVENNVGRFVDPN